MIRMIKGTYGLVKNGTVEPMTKHSPAFSINAAREAELVEAVVAVYEAEPESTFSEYNGLNMTELREAAAAYGVDASAVRSKKEVIALIEAAKVKADSSAIIEADPSEAYARELQRPNKAGSLRHFPESGRVRRPSSNRREGSPGGN